MLAFVTHVTLVLGCFNIKISANCHTIEKAAYLSQVRAGLNDGLFSETKDFRDFPSVLSAVRIAQSWYLAHSLPIV